MFLFLLTIKQKWLFRFRGACEVMNLFTVLVKLVITAPKVRFFLSRKKTNKTETVIDLLSPLHKFLVAQGQWYQFLPQR